MQKQLKLLKTFHSIHFINHSFIIQNIIRGWLRIINCIVYFCMRLLLIRLSLSKCSCWRKSFNCRLIVWLCLGHQIIIKSFIFCRKEVGRRSWVWIMMSLICCQGRLFCKKLFRIKTSNFLG